MSFIKDIKKIICSQWPVLRSIMKYSVDVRETRERRDFMPEVSRLIYPYPSTITSCMDDSVANATYTEIVV